MKFEQIQALWGTVKDQKSRYLSSVLERHAFFNAIMLKGHGCTEVARATGFNHATILYAQRMHSQNMKLEAYRKHFSRFYEQSDLQQDIQNIEKEIKYLLETRKKIREQIKELA